MAGDARLFVLATLQRLGEAHGHQVIREASTHALERWAHVSRGALYSALLKCEAGGLVEEVRTEQVGKFPRRTVYALTSAGREQFRAARSAAWGTTGIQADPFDLALSVSDTVPREELRAVVAERLAQYTAALDQLRVERETGCGHLNPAELAVFDHVLARHETEVAWHRQLLGAPDSFLAEGPPAR